MILDLFSQVFISRFWCNLFRSLKIQTKHFISKKILYKKNEIWTKISSAFNFLLHQSIFWNKTTVLITSPKISLCVFVCFSKKKLNCRVGSLLHQLLLLRFAAGQTLPQLRQDAGGVAQGESRGGSTREVRSWMKAALWVNETNITWMSLWTEVDGSMVIGSVGKKPTCKWRKYGGEFSQTDPITVDPITSVQRDIQVQVAGWEKSRPIF